MGAVRYNCSSTPSLIFPRVWSASKIQYVSFRGLKIFLQAINAQYNMANLKENQLFEEIGN